MSYVDLGRGTLIQDGYVKSLYSDVIEVYVPKGSNPEYNGLTDLEIESKFKSICTGVITVHGDDGAFTNKYYGFVNFVRVALTNAGNVKIFEIRKPSSESQMEFIYDKLDELLTDK